MSAALPSSGAPQLDPELVVLFEHAIPAEPTLLRTALRAFDRELSRAEVEVLADDERGVELELRWEGVRVELSGESRPFGHEALERCLVHSHFGSELRERARRHGAHTKIGTREPREGGHARWLAAAAVAGALASVGALLVVRPAARTSVPATLLARRGPSSLARLAEIGLPLLAVGFGKYELAESASVWMRTHAATRLGLPELAYEAQGHEEASHVAELFDDVLRHLLRESAQLEPGASLDLEGARYLVRALDPEEPTFAQAGPALVLERLGGA